MATWQQAHGWAPGWYARLGNQQLYIRAGMDRDTNAVLGWYAFVDGVKIGAFEAISPDQAKLAAERHAELQSKHGRSATNTTTATANGNNTGPRKRRSAAA